MENRTVNQKPFTERRVNIDAHLVDVIVHAVTERSTAKVEGLLGAMEARVVAGAEAAVSDRIIKKVQEMLIGMEERVAISAVNQLENRLYTNVGRNFINKSIKVIGIAIVGLLVYLTRKGVIGLG